MQKEENEPLLTLDREYKDGDVWHNWAGNISCKPEKIFYPENIEELKTFVKNAQKNGKKIRCAAEGHTWSSLSKTNDCLVILNKLDQVIIEKRDNGYVVHAEAGAQISKIDSVLESHDPPLTLTSMTIIDSVRIGGVVATGCHGAKTDARTIVDQVIGLQIVTADGKLREFSDEKNREEMEAARVSLGLLGVIYKVTFRAEPMYNLRMIDTFPSRKEFNSATLRDLVQNSDGVQIFYYPFNSDSVETEKIWVKRWVKTTDPLDKDALHHVFRRIAERATTEALADDFCQFVLSDPEKTPFIANSISKLKYVEHNEVWEAPYAIHYVSGVEYARCEDLEFAVKIDKNFDNVVTEINHVIDRIDEYAKEKKYPINLVFEFRILKSSSATLSNAYDEDPEAYYFFPEVLSIKGTKLYKEFSIEIGQRWMEKYKARPHWAKHWEYLPNIHQYIHDQLGERIKKFEVIRAKYDPNNTFFDNESLKRVFYGTQ